MPGFSQWAHPFKQEIEKIAAPFDIYKQLSSVLPSIKSASMILKDRGYKAYLKKDGDSASALFERALEIDNGNSFAQYNLACTLALKYRKTDKMRRKEIELRISEHLKEAAEKDYWWALKLFFDADRDSVRDYAFYGSSTRGGPYVAETNIEAYTFFILMGLLNFIQLLLAMVQMARSHVVNMKMNMKINGKSGDPF